MSGSPPEQFGSYLLFDELGVGGMASVHVAEKIGGSRKRVALKRLLPHIAMNEELVQLFIDEARLAAYLRHGNIAQTYEFGKVGGAYFIAMELVSGPNLVQLVRQCNATVGLIPPSVTLSIVAQLCDALDHAHNSRDERGRPLGIIHRDVSPPNIIMSNTGLVKLIDFGVAKAATAHRETNAGVIKGKFSYIAPEYLTGQLDSRVDLWALGVVAHELLTGRRLFDADDDFETMRRVRELKVEPPSRINHDVPAELDAIVLTALERDPARRWQTAAAMRTALLGMKAQVGPNIGNAQVIEWVEWAFTQKPGTRESGVSGLITLLDRPTSPAIAIDEPVIAITQPEPSLVITVESPVVTTRRLARVVWLLVVLVMLGAIAAALVYWDVLEL